MKKHISAFALAVQLLASAHADVGDVADFSGLEHVDFIQGELTAADLEGKVVILEYWGTHCIPCRNAMSGLQALYDKHKDAGLVIVCTELQASSRQSIKAYLDKKGLTFPVCKDFRLPQAPLQGNLPLTVLIGADGKVVFIGKPHQAEALVEGELAKRESLQQEK